MLWSLLWYAVVAGASYEAFRAWGPGGAGGTAVGLWLVSWLLPFGWLLSVGGACYIGYQAENELDRKQLTG